MFVTFLSNRNLLKPLQSFSFFPSKVLSLFLGHSAAHHLKTAKALKENITTVVLVVMKSSTSAVKYRCTAEENQARDKGLSINCNKPHFFFSSPRCANFFPIF